MSARALKMSEAQLQAAIIEAATALGWLTYHTFDSRRSNLGWPDLAMVRRGRMVIAELKAEKGVVSLEQQRWIDELGAVFVANDRVTVHIWYPRDWVNGTVEQVLRGDAVRRAA